MTLINELENEKLNLVNLENEKENFSEFFDYFNSLIDIELNFNPLKIKLSNKEIEFSCYNQNPHSETYYSSNVTFNIFINNDKLDFDFSFNTFLKSKDNLKEQVKIISNLELLLNKITFNEFNAILNQYIELNNNIKKQRLKLKKIENDYYLKYKQAIDKNFIHVSNENNINTINYWKKEETIFNSFFIIYFYKKNEIILDRISVKGELDTNNNYLLTIDNKLVTEKQILNSLNKTFYINNEVCYNFNFLKNQKNSNAIFNYSFDIIEFSKLFIIKNKIEEF